MKRWLVLTLLLVAGCSKAPPAQVAGTWSGAYDITAATTNLGIQLKQDGDKLTGTYDSTQMSARIGFEGKLTGSVDGDEVVFTMTVPEEAKKKYSYTDMEFKGVLATEDNQPVLKGWVTRSDNGQKHVMETFLSKAGK